MLISIVVPVYNIIEYLPACVDSILAQSFADYECLLVDDGATDGSGELCDRYAAEYPEHIKALHKENGGLSDARNYGTERAQGDYLLYVDGDDYIHPEALLWLAQKVQDCQPDIVLSEGCYIVDGDDIHLERYFDRMDLLTSRLPGEEGDGAVYERTSTCTGLQALWYTSDIINNWCAWGKLYRRSFWQDNGFAYAYGRIAEDMQLTDKVLLMAQRVCMVPAFTYYRYREGSLYRSVSAKYMEHILLNIEEWDQYFAAKAIPEQLKWRYRSLLASSFVDEVMAYLYRLPRPERKRVYEKAFPIRIYATLWTTKKGRRIRKLYYCLGFRATCFVLTWRKKMWTRLRGSVK